MRIHVGTSGYNYTEWKGTFYPADLPAKQMFGYYSAQFHTVEINYTFYRMPTDKTTSAWLAQAPPGFMYTLKAPQRITHIQKLQGSEDSLAMFVKAARVLGEHLACPAVSVAADVPVRSGAVARLSGRHAAGRASGVRVQARLLAERRRVCAARRASRGAVHRRLRRQDHAVAADGAAWLLPPARRRLPGWRISRAGRTRSWRTQTHWDEVFVYFKHEDEGKGPEFAKAFLDQLAQRQGGLEKAQQLTPRPSTGSVACFEAMNPQWPPQGSTRAVTNGFSRIAAARN